MADIDRWSQRIGFVALVFASVVTTACSSGGARPASAAPDRAIRSLTIAPRSTSVCPGDAITVRYEARTADGSRVTLGASEMERFYRSADAADPNDDGSWSTNPNPFVSVVSGFRLRAVLKSDTSVHADTVVVPSYKCDNAIVDLRGSLLQGGVSAYVRLGVLRTPFYDSIVVAAIEVGEQRPRMFLLPPSELRRGAIRIDASGRQGAQGRSGTTGGNVGPCERVSRGENGDDGGTGGSGGQVDIIIQSDAPWLPDLVSVSNSGGRGGAGGRGGQGTYSPAGPRASGGTCSAAYGQPGAPGRQGSNGLNGPPPRILNVLFPLLWPGSTAWSDVTTRYGLQQLIDYSARK